METTENIAAAGLAPASGLASTPPRVVRVAALDKVTGGLLALGCLTLLVVYFNNLWTKEYYQFYPLALAGAAFLAWSRLKEVPRPFEVGAWWVTGGLLGMAFLVLAAATFLWSGWLGMIGAFALALGAVWWLGGWTLTRALLPAGFMSLTVMRPPFNLDGRLTMKLQALATKWSSVALDGFGVTHALSGNVIEIPGQRLMVEEACSGINSILSTTAVCLFFCLWQRRRIWHILPMLGMTVGFVLLGNVTRIVSGAWLRYSYKIDILSGWKHETIGLVLFACYLGLIMSADQLLLYIFGPGRPTEDEKALPAIGIAPAATEATAPGAAAPKIELRRGPRWIAWTAALAFGLLGVVQLGRGTMILKGIYLGAPLLQNRILPPLNLPLELAGWQQIQIAGGGPTKVEMSGKHSQVWYYRRGSDVATVALDYPFSGYHDVTICYTGNGWEIYAKRTRPAAENPDGIPGVEAKMQRAMGSRASLWFSTFDQQGKWLDGSFVGRSFSERFREQTSSTTYRVQTLITSYLPLSNEAEESAASLFREARKLLGQQVVAELRSK
jgi:exosortase